MKRLRNAAVFIILLVGMSIFSYIPMTLFKIDLNRLSNEMKIMYEFSCNLGYMIVLYTLYRETINENLKSYFKDFKNNFKLAVFYYIIGYIIMITSNTLISIFVSSANANNENAVRALIDSYPLYMLFSVGIYAPFIEELIFRKSIKDIVIPSKDDNNKINRYAYIVISGFIFASLHVLGVSEKIVDYLYIIPYLALGIAFAAYYAKTDNIWGTIIMHSLHNLIALILYLGVGF